MGRWMAALSVSVVGSIVLVGLFLVLRAPSEPLCLRDLARELLPPAAYQTFDDWQVYKEPLSPGYFLVCSTPAEVHVGVHSKVLPWYIFHKDAGSLEVRRIGADYKPADGPGTVILADGSLTECHFVDNLCLGAGRAVDYSAHWFYEGEFRSGKKHGFGTFVRITGRNVTSDVAFTYKGEMRLDEIHGQGALTGSNFSYVGQFRWGKMTGYGVLTRPGKRLVGQFVDGELSGFGCEEDQWFATCGVFSGGVRDGKAVRMNALTLTDAKYLSFKDGVETWW